MKINFVESAKNVILFNENSQSNSWQKNLQTSTLRGK